MGSSVQNDFKRNVNPFVEGQIANGRSNQVESGQMIVNSTYTIKTIPFGYGVGWIDNPVTNLSLGGNACARFYTTSGSGASTVCTNFAGIAIRNVALPAEQTPIENSDDMRVLDAYNANDTVSIGSDGDYVVVCAADVSVYDPCYIGIAAGGNYGAFYGASAASGRARVNGAIFMTDSTLVTPSIGGSAVRLAVLRVDNQPR